MQKQLKQLDEELSLNHLNRVQDSVSKPANSFFRALSLSLFGDNFRAEYVKLVMKLTLITNCQISRLSNIYVKRRKRLENAFPFIPESVNLIEKFNTQPEMLQLYCKTPDLECFLNDNYELACFTFSIRLEVFYLQEEYLGQTRFSLVRKRPGNTIRIARVSKRFFSVEKDSRKKNQTLVNDFLLDYLLARVTEGKKSSLSDIFFSGAGTSKKISFSSNYEEVVKKFPKTHKKSLSQCGDTVNKFMEFESQNDDLDNSNANISSTIKKTYDDMENMSQQNQSYFFEYNSPPQQQKSTNEGQLCKESRQTEQIRADRDKQQNSQQQNQMTLNQQVVDKKTEEAYQQQEYSFQQMDSGSAIQTPITGKQQYAVYEPQMAQYYSAVDYSGYLQQEMYYNSYYGGNYYPHSHHQMQPMVHSSAHHHPLEDSNPYRYNQGSFSQSKHSQQNYPMQHHPHLGSSVSSHQSNRFPSTMKTATSVPQPTQNARYQGKLKFFDSNGKYGFIVIDGIGIDLFVHYDDLSKAGISKEQLEQHHSNREKLNDSSRPELRFEFTYYEYQGKNRKAKKAIDLQLLSD